MKEVRTKMLIIADDLTGALDSGVQLTSKGDRVIITANTASLFEYLDYADVIVADTETRHVSADEAYSQVYELTKKAISSGIKRVYKKTDSGLRGNVGAELTALLEATGAEYLAFAPAWPKMNRITKNGIQYVDGAPLSESIFAKDVIDPVSCSRVDELIHLQSNIAVSSYDGQYRPGINVFDSESDEQLTSVAEHLLHADLSIPMAGCAGLLDKFPAVSGNKEPARRICKLPKKLTVLSGSMNGVTLNQLNQAENDGAYRIHVPMDKIAIDAWNKDEISEFCREFLNNSGKSISIIDTVSSFSETRITHSSLADQISAYMGRVAANLLNELNDSTLMIIGGDTLQGFIKQMKVSSLEPVCDLSAGSILTKFTANGKTNYIITKSGGFGDEDLLKRITENL